MQPTNPAGKKESKRRIRKRGMPKVALLFISFVMLLLISNFTFAQTLRSQKQSKQGQRGQTVEERVEDLTLQLNLSKEQRKKITEILTKAKETTSKIVEEVSVKIKAIKNKAEIEVEGVLTKEQRNKYKGVPEEEEDDDTILKVFKDTQ